jgi:hypothetical protein
VRLAAAAAAAMSPADLMRGQISASTFTGTWLYHLYHRLYSQTSSTFQSEMLDSQHKDPARMSAFGIED